MIINWPRFDLVVAGHTTAWHFMYDDDRANDNNEDEDDAVDFVCELNTMMAIHIRSSETKAFVSVTYWNYGFDMSNTPGEGFKRLMF